MRLTIRRSIGARSALLAMFASFAVLIGPAAVAQQRSTPAHTVGNLPPKQGLLLQQMQGKSPPAYLLDNLSWVTGGPTSLESLRGKVVVLQLWRTGDPSGRSWLAIANASQKKFGTDDVAVIAIHTNDRWGQAESYIKGKPFTVTTAIDTNGALTRFLHGKDNPMNLILDRQGAVVAGGLTGRGLNMMVKKLVNQPFSAAAPLPTEFIDVDVATTAVANPKPSDNANPPLQDPDPAPTASVSFPPYKNAVSNALDFRGKKAPPLGILTWLNGEPRAQGKVLIIDFWATWCGPCVASIPDMNEHAARFADEVVIIGISNEEKRVVQKFLKKTEMRYTVAVDTTAQMQRAMQVRAIPHVAVISPDGIVRYQGHPAHLTDTIIEQIIEASKSLND